MTDQIEEIKEKITKVLKKHGVNPMKTKNAGNEA